MYTFTRRYEIEADKWTSLASMTNGRLYAAIANLSGRIFVMGGRSSSGPNGCLSSAECYDPATNAWSTVASMISKRAGARAGVVNGHLYVVGGYDGSNCLSTIEKYDQENNEWTMVRASFRTQLFFLLKNIFLFGFQINIQLNNARCDFGMVLYENQVVVAGGGSVKGAKSCEQLELLSGQKKYVLPMLASKICCHLFQFER